MNSNFTIKAAVGAALFGAFSMSAFATSVTPPASGPTPDPGSVNGGLVIEVFDTTTSTALLEWVGGDLGTFGTPAATPAGGVTLDYGILGGSTVLAGGSTEFNTLFSASEIAAGNVKYAITAANNVNTAAPIVDETQAGTPATLTLNGLKSIAAATVTGVGSFMNGAANCNNVNPCTATAATQPAFQAISDFTPAGSVGVVAGTAVSFYQIVASGTALTHQVFNQFGNATGTATWTLSSAGDLVYSVPGGAAVPLPAALWLFGSGLLGLAGVARRKSLAA